MSKPQSVIGVDDRLKVEHVGHGEIVVRIVDRPEMAVRIHRSRDGDLLVEGEKCSLVVTMRQELVGPQCQNVFTPAVKAVAKHP